MESRGAPPAPVPVVEYISPAPVAVSSLEPVVEFRAPAPAVEYIAPAPAVVQAPTPVMEPVAPVPAVFQAPTPVVEYLVPAPAVIPSPAVECMSPVPVVDAAPAPVVEFIAPAAHTQQRLQTQRHTYRLSTARRVEGASRLRQVLCRVWTRPGTCLTCRWSHAGFRGALGVRVETHEEERETVRRLCCISVMSCSRGLLMGIR